MDDPHQLQRFVDAQQRNYAQALAEIRAGRKTSHWMWYVFPQFAGLGFSSTSRRYAIRSLAEARAYLEHPLLGERLRECVDALLACGNDSASAIFGWPDDMKLKSSMTLFAEVANGDNRYDRVLQVFYDGRRDRKTLDLIDRGKADG